MGVPSKKGKGGGKGKGAKGKDTKRQGSTNHQARHLCHAFSAAAVRHLSLFAGMEQQATSVNKLRARPVVRCLPASLPCQCACYSGYLASGTTGA